MANRMVLELLTSREKQILKYLTRNPKKSAFEVSVDLRITQSTVYKALNRLAREGLVKSETVGGSDLWIAVNKDRFREIFVNAVDNLIKEVYG